jgi:SAM-dependent methyltransferase
MHDTAEKFGTLFFNQYFPYLPASESKLLVEVGSGPDQTFVKAAQSLGTNYLGVDQLHSEEPEIEYKLNLPDESADIVVSSSCFEHDEFFWVTYLEILRILKPHGLFYLNAPSCGVYHAYPVDCYRFYADSGRALEKWGRKNRYKVKMLEYFIGMPMNDPAKWNDYVVVWVKDENFASLYPNRIQDADSKIYQNWKIDPSQLK